MQSAPVKFDDVVKSIAGEREEPIKPENGLAGIKWVSFRIYFEKSSKLVLETNKVEHVFKLLSRPLLLLVRKQITDIII